MNSYVIVGKKDGVDGCVISCGYYSKEDAYAELRNMLDDAYLTKDYSNIHIEKEVLPSWDWM